MPFKTLTNWNGREKRPRKHSEYIQDAFPLLDIDWSIYKRIQQRIVDSTTEGNIETELVEYLDDAATSFDTSDLSINDNYSIWKVNARQYSICMQLTDTNYSVLSDEHKMAFLQKHWDFLNSTEQNCTTTFTVCNRYLQDEEIAQKQIPVDGTDRLDKLRIDLNSVIETKARTASRIRKDIYVTISAQKNDFEEARLFFNNVTQSTVRRLEKMGVHCEVLDDANRFQLLKSFLQNDQPRSYDREKELAEKNLLAAFAPNEMTFKPSFFKTDGQYGRVFYIHEFPAFLNDTLLVQLSNIQNPMMVSMDIVPIPTVEAMKQLRNINTGIETNIAEYTRRQNKQNNFNASIPPDLEEARNNTREMIADISGQNQRLFFSQIMLVCLADSMKDLKQATAKLNSIVSEHGCALTVMRSEQEDGLMTVLPFGVAPCRKPRTFLTEALSSLLPYNVQEVDHETGLYYGTNPISRNMIFVDRTLLPNGNAILLGTSGSGKSFIAKREMLQVALKYKQDHILVIDPEREYAPMVRALGGTVVKISSTTKNYINPLDIAKDLLTPDRMIEDDVIRNKNEFVLTLCEEIMQHPLTAMERSVIDRCVSNIYAHYTEAFREGKSVAYIQSLTPPTLKDFYEELKRQKEGAAEAKDIALSIELYVTGSMDIFAHQSTVDINNKIVAFDILELGKQLKTVAMLVILEFVQGRVTENRFSNKSGQEVRHTWLYIDECHVLLKHQQSADYLFNLWKRLRKYAGLPTAITQNIPDLLQSEQSLAIFSNSDLKILCRQAEADQKLLGEYMHFTEAQMSYISTPSTGGGALLLTTDFIPFADKWDRNSLTYKYMSTKPGEDSIQDEEPAMHHAQK